MKVVVLNASPRKNGLVSQMLNLIIESLPQGCESSLVHINSLTLRPCIGCMKCRTTLNCCLPEDDAQRILKEITEADALIVGSPCYWGNMNGYLKVLFDRIVYGMMGESPSGVPIPLHKGKQAIIVTTCTTPFPFNILFKQSRGTVKALREILKWSGFKIVGTLEKGGTRKHPELTESEKKKCIRLARKLKKN
ncbi:MAG: flavodoxin family protein [Paludibacteraceae bacterium]|nr:flavodoxin family protein [Paludibacteraceae bacterium]